MRTRLFFALLGGVTLATAPLAPALAQKKGATEQVEEISLTKTYIEDVTDPLPEFAGGLEVLRKFLAANVIVPPFALANELAAAVDVEFVLHPDGHMDSIRVSNGACCGLNEEAERVAGLTAGKWTPGYIKGTAVKTRVELSVVFRIANKNTRSLAYLEEMRAKYATYQQTGEYRKDQQTYQDLVTKQPKP
jgi:hypothetical protein